jgi:hypothetical protein
MNSEGKGIDYEMKEEVEKEEEGSEVNICTYKKVSNKAKQKKA